MKRSEAFSSDRYLYFMRWYYDQAMKELANNLQIKCVNIQRRKLIDEWGKNMNPDNPFLGRSVAITGKLDHYTRAGIKARLLELGAKPVSAVSRRTGYLIVGERPGSKLDKARTLGVSILTERDFENMAG